MKRKEIEFDAEALIDSVRAMAAHVRGNRKLTMRTTTLQKPATLLVRTKSRKSESF
jgi:hypothetical protein